MFLFFFPFLFFTVFPIDKGVSDAQWDEPDGCCNGHNDFAEGLVGAEDECCAPIQKRVDPPHDGVSVVVGRNITDIFRFDSCSGPEPHGLFPTPCIAPDSAE